VDCTTPRFTPWWQTLVRSSSVGNGAGQCPFRRLLPILCATVIMADVTPAAAAGAVGLPAGLVDRDDAGVLEARGDQGLARASLTWRREISSSIATSSG